jgi:hypothetical protein
VVVTGVATGGTVVVVTGAHAVEEGGAGSLPVPMLSSPPTSGVALVDLNPWHRHRHSLSQVSACCSINQSFNQCYISAVLLLLLLLPVSQAVDSIHW